MKIIEYKISSYFDKQLIEILLNRNRSKNTLEFSEGSEADFRFNEIGFLNSEKKNRRFFGSPLKDGVDYVWTIRTDLIAKGGIRDVGKDGKLVFLSDIISVYGIKLQPKLVEALKISFEFLESKFDLEPVEDIYALYRGIPYEAAEEFVEDCEIQESKVGMLGPGVYLGSFWKATRFAGWSSEQVVKKNKAREGIILRCYVNAEILKEAPWEPCECKECMRAVRILSLPKSSKERKEFRGESGGFTYYTPEPVVAERTLVDHLGRWREEADAAFIKPQPVPGIEKVIQIVRNEEWVTKKENVRIVGFAILNADSMGDRYYALKRDSEVF
jgi:hypothetical protein